MNKGKELQFLIQIKFQHQRLIILFNVNIILKFGDP